MKQPGSILPPAVLAAVVALMFLRLPALSNQAAMLKPLKAAAARGQAAAQHDLGGCYLLGKWLPKDAAEAAVWFRKAADQGHAPSRVQLGRCFAEGNGVPHDDAKAVAWFRKAAELDSLLPAVLDRAFKGEL